MAAVEMEHPLVVSDSEELFPSVQFDPSMPFEKQLVKVCEEMETFRPFSFEKLNKRVSVQAGHRSHCSYWVNGTEQHYPTFGLRLRELWAREQFAIADATTFEV